MAFSKLSNLSTLVLGLALVAPAIACVEYTAYLDYDGDVLNANLIDNGQQTCVIYNWAENGASEVEMGCEGDYAASIDLDAGVVTYSYPGFVGSFGTDYSPNGNGESYTASVWGC